MRPHSQQRCLLLLSAVRLAQATSLADYIVAGLGVGSSTTDISSATSVATPQPTGGSIPAVVTSLHALYSNGSVDECYSSWDRWLSASWLETWGTYVDYTTFTTRWTQTAPAYNGSTYVATETVDTTQTILNGMFPMTTETVHTTYTSSETIASTPAKTSTGGGTFTYSHLSTQNNTLAKPTCVLPSIVSQCQSQWERWITTQLVPGPTPPPHCDINAGFLQNTNTVPPCATSYASVVASYGAYIDAYPSPLCTQVCLYHQPSVGGPLCDSVRQNYVSQENYQFAAETATTQYLPFFSAGYQGGPMNETAGDWDISWTWPTASTLGVPSCTLGCGRCAVTGGTVQLIYWPETATSFGSNYTVPRTNPASPVTVETLGTTFTSPTLYISYSSVYAANGCSVIGNNITNTIVAIPTNSPLSSVYGGTIPCDAHMRYTQEWTATAPFTVADLNEPVPYSIYSSQPWCATYLRNQGCEGTCPLSLGYKPILVVPEEVLQNLQPAWATCYGDIRGQYDPPMALQQTSVAAGPTVPIATTTTQMQTQSATPASGPESITPSATATPYSATLGSESVPGGTQTLVESESSTTTASAQEISLSQVSPTPPYDPSATSPDNPDEGPISEPSTADSPDIDSGSAQGLQTSTSRNDVGILVSVLTDGFSVTLSNEQNPNEATASVVGLSSDTTASGTGSSEGDLSQTGHDAASPMTSVEQPVATVGSQVYTIVSLLSNGEDYIGTDTQANTVYSTSPQSLDPGAVVVANDGSTVTLSGSEQTAALNGQVVGAASLGGVVIGSGSSATTVYASTQTVEAVITANGQRYTQIAQTNGAQVFANSDSSFTIPTDGAAIAVGSETVSMVSTGEIVVGSRTYTLTADNTNAMPTTSGNIVLTVGSQIYSLSKGPNGQEIVDAGSTTLTLSSGGSAMTIDGQTLSLASEGALVAGQGSYSTTVSVGDAISTSSSNGQVTASISSSVSPSESPATTSTSSAGKLFAPWLGVLTACALKLVAL
ncbi:hypothetical protein LTR22_017401 [Elasticomyces elasticus]|nr:hypothetical protein LTR22_017401 [Elasticomyces elasticus]KAK4913191.1 hypothetical protein LTR49_018465 [Elasticomyces elasticus]KAK5752773.1 hypothetical protein LTS12_017156 [Elasticomyces elasticus]